MKRTSLSKAELKIQTLVRRAAHEQLLRVPWKRFRRAYEEYPRWLGLSLWTDVVCGRIGRKEISIGAALNRYLPGFLQSRARLPRPEPLALAVLKWVHNEIFGYAKQEGWLDALVFYGVRHSHSLGVWSYWEHGEGKWAQQRPNELASFEQWWRSALRYELWGRISSIALNTEVERYLEWEAFKLWLRPFFFHAAQLRPDVARDLARYCPRISCSSLKAPGGDAERWRVWRGLERAGADQLLTSARKDRRVAGLLEQVRSHPWHARVRTHASRQKGRWAQSADSYPSFRRWKRSLEV